MCARMEEEFGEALERVWWAGWEGLWEAGADDAVEAFEVLWERWAGMEGGGACCRGWTCCRGGLLRWKGRNGWS